MFTRHKNDEHIDLFFDSCNGNEMFELIQIDTDPTTQVSN